MSERQADAVCAELAAGQQQVAALGAVRDQLSAALDEARAALASNKAALQEVGCKDACCLAALLAGRMLQRTHRILAFKISICPAQQRLGDLLCLLSCFHNLAISPRIP